MAVPLEVLEEFFANFVTCHDQFEFSMRAEAGEVWVVCGCSENRLAGSSIEPSQMAAEFSPGRKPGVNSQINK
jgi:hypothetical protein